MLPECQHSDGAGQLVSGMQLLFASRDHEEALGDLPHLCAPDLPVSLPGAASSECLYRCFGWTVRLEQLFI